MQSGKCSLQYVIESNGQVYPCDFYTYQKNALGWIQTDSITTLTKSKKAQNFLKPREISNKCQKCPYLNYCRLGCKKFYKDDQLEYCQAIIKFYENYLNKIDKVVSEIKIEIEKKD